MMHLVYRSATELVAMIRRRAVSARELTQAFIDRIERLGPQINAVVVHDFDRALDAARHADAALARGERLGPLHGLPVTVKESFDVEGLPTTWGLEPFATQAADADAVLVERARAAGAVVLGKTNVPVMLGDYQARNPIYGQTNNPWDVERTPGGSSGGSAAAVASGMTGLGFGSDLGGSIRVPAHCCGVFAHKPTWGIVPMRGQAPPMAQPRLEITPDLAVVGPVARAAEDLALALDVVAGADRLASGWQLCLPPPRAREPRGLRVAVWANDGLAPVAKEIEERIRSVARQLEAAGATVADDARPAIDPAHMRRTFVGLSQAMTGASVPDDVYAEFLRDAAAVADDDDSRAAVATRALVASHRQWAGHDRARHALRAAWAQFFEDWDVVLCPVMAVTAQRHDDRHPAERTIDVDGQAQSVFQQVFWSSLATVAYLPATVVPAGLSGEGLPIGLQLLGPAFADRTTIEVARMVATLVGGFSPPP